MYRRYEPLRRSARAQTEQRCESGQLRYALQRELLHEVEIGVGEVGNVIHPFGCRRTAEAGMIGRDHIIFFREVVEKLRIGDRFHRRGGFVRLIEIGAGDRQQEVWLTWRLEWTSILRRCGRS